MGGGCVEEEERELSLAEVAVEEVVSLPLPLAAERAQREKCAIERYISFAGRVKLRAG